ncbi:hypothetical protein ATK17_3905 [Branchiibius hedensis]|uniref:Uncharacterized protein n=1 Tax=Branchiibius hedensis TaxID=672460 RepID=A0A2Y9BPK0_9MICO|nr:hypothetical protein [Branchiibius hedensis]PWJ23014.1 hypothetical protein ATK17_3905 [Branchiibius hedensis]SSA59090.1 hypothetical protein SAMN04489750_3905 [Branchiibius hedensis]
MDAQKPTATLTEVWRTLDELVAAVRAADGDRYRELLNQAERQEITEEQIRDAHAWAMRTPSALQLHPADFDWRGRTVK